jgi:Arc/MetJ-type ribon-helix-helix transcriptional regulator
MTESDLAVLDDLIKEGRFANRSEALRAGFARLLDDERERAIEAAYRKGYAEHPQEEWIGQVGLAGLEQFDRTEGGKPL